MNESKRIIELKQQNRELTEWINSHIIERYYNKLLINKLRRKIK